MSTKRSKKPSSSYSFLDLTSHEVTPFLGRVSRLFHTLPAAWSPILHPEVSVRLANTALDGEVTTHLLAAARQGIYAGSHVGDRKEWLVNLISDSVPFAEFWPT